MWWIKVQKTSKKLINSREKKSDELREELNHKRPQENFSRDFFYSISSIDLPYTPGTHVHVRWGGYMFVGGAIHILLYTMAAQHLKVLDPQSIFLLLP
jgi:hypothetical protein